MALQLARQGPTYALTGSPHPHQLRFIVPTFLHILLCFPLLVLSSEDQHWCWCWRLLAGLLQAINIQGLWLEAAVRNRGGSRSKAVMESWGGGTGGAGRTRRVGLRTISPAQPHCRAKRRTKGGPGRGASAWGVPVLGSPRHLSDMPLHTPRDRRPRRNSRCPIPAI